MSIWHDTAPRRIIAAHSPYIIRYRKVLRSARTKMLHYCLPTVGGPAQNVCTMPRHNMPRWLQLLARKFSTGIGGKFGKSFGNNRLREPAACARARYTDFLMSGLAGAASGPCRGQVYLPALPANARENAWPIYRQTADSSPRSWQCV